MYGFGIAFNNKVGLFLTIKFNSKWKGWNYLFLFISRNIRHVMKSGDSMIVIYHIFKFQENDNHLGKFERN